jgi:TonB family protein
VPNFRQFGKHAFLPISYLKTMTYVLKKNVIADGDSFALMKRHISSEGVVSMQTISRVVRSAVLSFLILITLSGSCPPAGLAQDKIDRKIKSRVQPVYPEIARKMGLAGNVKLQLVVSPNGEVRETKVIGGHPILVNAAVDAVKKWRFETASAESTGTVEFRFDPGN